MVLFLSFTILSLLFAYLIYLILTPSKKKKVNYFNYDGGKFKKETDDL